MQQITKDNAANRTSYVGKVHSVGEDTVKENILNSLPKDWARLHKEGYIHIHDLDAYGHTYNCLTFDLERHFPCSEFKGLNETSKILHLFHLLQSLFIEIGNEQSGGMAFANFDNELANMLSMIGVEDTLENESIIRSSMREFILWCNNDHTRMGKTSYYVTFNIGLADYAFSRKIAQILLEEFESLGDKVYKPNIVFKVHKGKNLLPEDPNHDLLLKALSITAKKMIPTYLLCDSKPNQNIDPYKLAIMGCRTRVVDDIYGMTGAIGRGNITNISINLPRIALDIDRESRYLPLEEKINLFKESWNFIAYEVKNILLDRYKKLCALKKDEFPTNLGTQLWCESFDTEDLSSVFRHGTLSIGFIGLGETIEVLTGLKYYQNMNIYMHALGLVKHMRDYCDFLRNETKLNFSLLATSGELISGRFIDLDKNQYKPMVDIFSKGFYTNSFHIDVDSKLPAYKKIQMEGLFHELCNGGCITYIELGEAPLGNTEGLLEYLNIAIESGTHYLGFNFPKDICDDCQATGVFDVCPNCNSTHITRIRRVSGYLEILDGFTKGKKNEVQHRLKN